MRCLFRLLTVVMCLATLGACALSTAVNVREGIDSFRVEDYRKAFIRLKPAAEKGQPDAQYAVGYMYYYGKGVVEDRKKAWFWINAAANLGQPDAKEAIRILKRGGSLS